MQETQNGSEIKQNRFSYDLNGNQLTKDEVVKRNGNTISSKSTQFWYDGYNQLQRVQDANGMYTEYKYNGVGLRTKKESGDKATNYIYNNNDIIAEADEDFKFTAKNIRGLKLIYRESYANSISDPAYLYYLHNAHGDVTELLNDQGDIIKDYGYHPFGDEISVRSLAFGGKQAAELWRQEIEEIDNPFRYAGEYHDAETGNYYLRARYYDPTSQRFINEDSYGVEKGSAWLDHLYSFGNNNPLIYIDPSGHDPVRTKSGKAVMFIHGLSGGLGTFEKMLNNRNFKDIGQVVKVQIGKNGGQPYYIDDYGVRLINKPQLATGKIPLIQISFVNNQAPVEWQSIWTQRIADMIGKDYNVAEFDIVAHSAGGLTARKFAIDYSYRINQIITLGTPHKGSGAAVGLAPIDKDVHNLFNDLNPFGSFIKSINSGVNKKRYLDKNISSVAIAGKSDAVVNPNSAFGLPGAFKILFNTGHTGLHDDDNVIKSVFDLLFGG